METLASVSQVFLYLLPIVGVITLCFLISVLIKMRGIMNNVNVTVTGVNDAVGTTNGYLKELNTTVKSVNNMAMSVEAVRATTERAVKKAAKTASKQYDQVKTAVGEIIEKAAAVKEEKEKEPKNIVKVASIEEKKPEEKAVEAVKEVIEAAENAVKE